ncbi:Imm1 family immunity protein [Streptomyces sp. NBC_00178]|uniref:Imm1 family immunity protein n=1 Tax=Streptomyces sp. NBC_00178 TaxID=2975672 RepID=UPI002E2B773C|nr:Imm1 family immunity protein [Streptomyces sp. NBC_00178]
MKARAEAQYRYEHGETPRILYSIDDIDSVIDDLLESTQGLMKENLASIYSLDRVLLPAGTPDHELMVGVDRGLGVGLVAFSDAGGNFVSKGSSDTRIDPVYFQHGHLTEFSEHSEVPIPLVRQAAKEFLTSGGLRPTCVRWQDLDAWG